MGIAFIIALAALALAIVVALPVADARAVLVLGGTQFMGRHMVESLLAQRTDGDTIAMLNRGVSRNPFDDAVKAGKLLHLKCDRMQDRARFRRLVADTVDRWDVIVDFIGFHETFARDAVAALRRSDGSAWKVGTYVHISTDSVYQAMPLPQGHARPLTEDCCEPLEEGTPEWDAHQALAGRTDEGRYQLQYGGNKLTVDTFLRHAWEAGRFPYVSLRIPDVYGPYDNLGGFWQHFVAPVLQREKIGVFLPPARMRPRGDHKDVDDYSSHKMSWVFAPDVVTAVHAVAAAGHAAHGKVLHIAHTEHVSVAELAGVVAAQLNEIAGKPPHKPKYGLYKAMLDERDTAAMPQHDIGPLDVSRALALLDGAWAPTPLAEGVKRSITWFLASAKHRKYARAVQRRLREHDAAEERRREEL